jgi:hypothetical protein
LIAQINKTIKRKNQNIYTYDDGEISSGKRLIISIVDLPFIGSQKEYKVKTAAAIRLQNITIIRPMFRTPFHKIIYIKK